MPSTATAMRKIFYGVFIAANSFFILNLAFAGEKGQTGGSGGGVIELQNPLCANNCTIFQIISNVIDYLMYISVPILAIVVLIGGFQILVARDSAEKVKKGMDTLKYAAIGFAIVLISKGIALVLVKVLTP